MKRYILLIPVIFFLSCSSTKYFIVRHAEKDATSTMTSDVPLSEAGKQRAIALKDELKDEKINHIFSTNYMRTKSTAQPLSDAINVGVEVYNPGDTSFVTRVKNLKGNVLIVGHSNTVDDLVNKFLQEKRLQDLPETSYGDLFIIKKKGNKYTLEQKRFGL